MFHLVMLLSIIAINARIDKTVVWNSMSRFPTACHAPKNREVESMGSVEVFLVGVLAGAILVYKLMRLGDSHEQQDDKKGKAEQKERDVLTG